MIEHRDTENGNGMRWEETARITVLSPLSCRKYFVAPDSVVVSRWNASDEIGKTGAG
jgi:hypothetical protein